MLLKQLESLKYFVHQGLAIRGHSNNDEGNLDQLFLRSTMTQKRLNNVVLMHTHKERTDKVNLLSIAKDFVTSNERRANYFEHY